MKAKFDFGRSGQTGVVTFFRGDDDPKFYGISHAKGEHALFYFLKKWLNERGFALVKVRAQDDGNMVGDEYQPYLRTTLDWPRLVTPHCCIISGFYALRGANEDWNKGSVTLDFHGGYLEQDTIALVKKLCKGRKEMRCGGN